MKLKKTLLFLLFVLVIRTATAQTPDQSNSGSNDWYTCLIDNQVIGQSFTAGKSGSLSSIALDFAVNSCPDGGNSYTFVTDIINGDGFNGAVLATDTVTVPMPYSRNMLTISFSNQPTVTNGQMYTIRLTPMPHQTCFIMGPDTEYVCADWFESQGDSYAGGIPYLNGSQDQSNDKYFETFVTSNCGVTADQSNSGSNDWYTCLIDNQVIGQSFTAGKSGGLSSVALDFAVNSCPDGGNSYTFVTDIINGDGYNGAVLATDTVTVSMPYSRNMLNINFSNQPTVTNGQMYTIRLTPMAQQTCFIMGPDTEYVCADWFEGQSDTYAGGIPYINGTQDQDYDKYFTTYVNTNSYATDNANAVDNYTGPAGEQWTNTGTYVDTISNAAGCDSIITTNLTVCHTSLASVSANAVFAYTSPSGKFHWTGSGMYNDTLTNVAGCDSIITINLTVSGCGMGIDQSNLGDNDWYTCTIDGQVVGQSFTSGQTGSLTAVGLDFNVNSCQLASNNYSFITDIINGDGYNGAVLATDTVNVSMPFSRNMLSVNFTTPAYVTSGQMYTIRLTPIAHQACFVMFGDTEYVCADWFESQSDTYTGGIPYLNGSQDQSYDKYFTTTVNTNTYSVLNVTTDGIYISPSGKEWSVGGTYTDTIPNAISCDSIITINLTIGTLGLFERNAQAFSIYPNPASFAIDVKIDNSRIGSNYVITDAVGKTILTGKLNAENELISVDALSEGLYIFSLSDKTKQMFAVVKN